MYKFIDVNEVSESAVLPSEALQINGEYIENLIPGYRTLSVSGREALSPELSTYETGVRDGATLKSKRYPARKIIVQYQLIAESNEAFREAYNQLAYILNVENAELIFNDETDKFFTGTPSAIEEVEPGKNAVIGEFEILCTDPFKYSVQEYEVTPTVGADGTFTIDYGGTYHSYPKIQTDFYKETETSADGTETVELQGAGECGCVIFYNDNEKIIQLGDPKEVDGYDAYPMSQTLYHTSFDSVNGWGTAAKKLWNVNSGVTSSYAVEQKGTPGIKPDDAIQHFLTAADWGSGDNWHGPSISRVLPADEAGDIGAKHFYLAYAQKMCIGNGTKDVNQYGAFQCLVTDADDKIICGISIYKGTAGKSAKLRTYVNNSVAETRDIDLSFHNVFYGIPRLADSKKGIKAVNPVHSTIIDKIGDTVRFYLGNMCLTYKNSAIAGMKATKVTYTFSKFANRTPLYLNGLFWSKFIKHHCETWKDIPNKFSANDVLLADCGTGEIFHNGVKDAKLGALGNDWEGFYLKPGINTIGVYYSDWVTDEYAPTFTLKYREVFL